MQATYKEEKHLHRVFLTCGIYLGFAVDLNVSLFSKIGLGHVYRHYERNKRTYIVFS